jgi:hypothetical protein
MTGIAVIDSFVEQTQPRSLTHNDINQISDSQPNDLDSRVLKAVHYDPFASIRDLKHEINRNPGTEMASWWQVFLSLKRHGLLRRRARFRYARNRDRSSF